MTRINHSQIRQYGLATLAAILVRIYAIRYHPHIMGDALVYGDLATNMLRHHRFAFTEPGEIRSTLIRLPGYPVLIAACFALFGIANYASVLYLQLILDVATCLLLASLATRLMGRRAGVCTLWLAALCPFTTNYVAAAYTETPAIFCLALAFFCLERWQAGLHRGWRNRWLWPLALTLAYNCQLRPDRALLAVAIVPAMAWLAWNATARTHALAQVAATCLIILTPVALWTIRNERVYHVFQPLAPKQANDPGERVYFGFERWYRTWAIDFQSTDEVYWAFDGAALSIDDLPARAFDAPDQRAATAAIFARYNLTTAGSVPVDAAFAALAVQRIHAHPIRYYVFLPIARVANMWLRPRTELLELPLDWWRFPNAIPQRLLAAAFGLINLAYLVLAAIGLWRWRRQGWSTRRTLGYAMVAFVLLRSAMLLTMDNSEPRYTMDCYPIVILLAAFALASRRRSTRIMDTR